MTTASKIIAASTILALAGVANADTVSMAFTGTGHGQNLKVTDAAGTNNYFVGQLIHNITGATGGNTPLNGSKTTFCVDLFQTVSGSPSAFDIVPVSGLFSSLPSALATVRTAGMNDIFAAYGPTAISSGASNDFGAAFQMIVWEMMYDFDGTAGSLSVTSGSVKFKDTDGSSVSSGIMTQFNLIKASVGLGHISNSLVGLVSGARQDQIVYLPPNTLPTPGAAALVGLGGMMWSRRRR